MKIILVVATLMLAIAARADVTMQVNSATGSDAWTASDTAALEAGTKAFKSAQGCFTFALNYLHMSTIYICHQQAGDPVTIHWAPHGSIDGAQGGVGVMLDCDSNSMTGNPGAQVYFGGKIFLNSWNTFYPVSGGAIFSCGSGGQINGGSSINIFGGSGSALIVMSGNCNATLPPINQMGNLTWSWTATYVGGNSNLGLTGWAQNGMSSSYPGAKAIVTGCGSLAGQGYIPGASVSPSGCGQVD